MAPEASYGGRRRTLHGHLLQANGPGATQRGRGSEGLAGAAAPQQQAPPRRGEALALACRGPGALPGTRPWECDLAHKRRRHPGQPPGGSPASRTTPSDVGDRDTNARNDEGPSPRRLVASLLPPRKPNPSLALAPVLRVGEPGPAPWVQRDRHVEGGW